MDQGTPGTRSDIFDRSGHLVSLACKEHTRTFLRPGWVEHDPVEIWQRTRKVMKETLDRGGIGPGDLSSIGVASQGETILLGDRRTGNPIHNAIVWQCRRTVDMCGELTREGFAEIIRERTGLVLDPCFSDTRTGGPWTTLTGREEGRRTGLSQRIDGGSH